MQMTQAAALRPDQPYFGARGARASSNISGQPGSEGFAALLAAFRATGGTARADDLARLLSDSGDAGGPSLAVLLAEDEVFGLPWLGSLWVPMFQFELRTLTPLRAPQRVRAELGGLAADGWHGAAWFARAHDALNDSRPVDLLATDLLGVLAAARADRWVVQG